jgi:hypothetical protein
MGRYRFLENRQTALRYTPSLTTGSNLRQESDEKENFRMVLNDTGLARAYHVLIITSCDQVRIWRLLFPNPARGRSIHPKPEKPTR